MLEKEKARGGKPRAGGKSAKGDVPLFLNYTLDSPQKQAPCKPYISGPLDLAIAQIEHHRALARFHYAELCRHKLIKVELEKLVFGGDL